MYIFKSVSKHLTTQNCLAMLQSKNIFGLNIITDTIDNFYNYLINSAKSNSRLIISYANAHTINLSYKNRFFYQFLKNSDIIYPDGASISASLKIKHHIKTNRITLTNSFFELLALINKNNLTVFFFGTEETILKKTIQIIENKFGTQLIAGYSNGYQYSNDDLITQINNSGADIVFVGMGSPLQEEWISKNQSVLQPPILWSVGALFDFYGHKNVIAPVLFQKLCLEWTWRLLQEPRRLWKRYLFGNISFLYRLIQDLIHPRH